MDGPRALMFGFVFLGLIGCQQNPTDGVISRAPSFSPVALFPFGPNASCRTDVPSFPQIDGHIRSADHANGGGRETLTAALNWFNLSISSAVRNAERERALAVGMTRMANAGAFTETVFTEGSNPKHWQMNLLKNVAIAVSLLDARTAWVNDERDAVVAWGNSMWRNSENHRGWPDTNAVVGSAGVFWGAATGNVSVLNKGLSRTSDVLDAISADGTLDVFFPSLNPRFHDALPSGWGVRINDKMIGDLVMAAYVARRSGVELFAKPNRDGGTLAEAVGWWDTVLFAGSAGPLSGQDLSFLRTTGQEASWSWTAYWRAAFPDDPATARLRARSLSIENRTRAGYVGLATGPATCLFGG